MGLIDTSIAPARGSGPGSTPGPPKMITDCSITIASSLTVIAANKTRRDRDPMDPTSARIKMTAIEAGITLGKWAIMSSTSPLADIASATHCKA